MAMLRDHPPRSGVKADELFVNSGPPSGSFGSLIRGSFRMTFFQAGRRTHGGVTRRFALVFSNFSRRAAAWDQAASLS